MVLAATCDLDPDVGNVAAVFTYGAPRIGNMNFLQQIHVQHHRWVNNNDVVPRGLGLICGYRDHGKLHYLNAWGNVRHYPGGVAKVLDAWMGRCLSIAQCFRCKYTGPDALLDHKVDAYLQFLQNYANGINTPETACLGGSKNYRIAVSPDPDVPDKKN